MGGMGLTRLAVNTRLEPFLKLLKSTTVYCAKCIIMITALLWCYYVVFVNDWCLIN